MNEKTVTLGFAIWFGVCALASLAMTGLVGYLIFVLAKYVGSL